MRLVFFALLDGALVQVEIFERGETLHGLLGEISVGHGMANDHRLVALFAERGGDQARDGTLAASGASGADRNHGYAGFDLSVLGAEQPEIGSGGDHARGEVHERGIRDVAIREDDGVDVFVGDDLLQIFLFEDGDAVPDRGDRRVRAGTVGRQCRESESAVKATT